MGATDAERIAQAMKAEFDRPGQPLLVEPVTVEGIFAIAGWSQGGSGGRALLQHMGNEWQIVLCAGDSLLQPTMLTHAGMTREASTRLVANTRAAESRLPSARRDQFANFQGVVNVGTGAGHKNDAAGHAAHASTAGAAAAVTVSVSGAWGRATPPGIPNGVAYFTIENRGRQPDTLLSISSPVSASAELHRTTVQNGHSTMRPAGQVVITPGQTVKAEPGGLHVMLTGLKRPLAAGNPVPLVLNFRAAGAITVQMDVHPLSPASH